MNKRKIIAVWAEDINGLIGKDNGLPWKKPEDLKHIIYKRTNFVPSDKNDKEFLDWCNNIVKEGSVDYYKTLLNKTKKELEEEKGD